MDTAYPTPPLTVAAVLLAGGESRRMGSPKETLIFDGEPLWQRQLKLLGELGPQETFISARREWAWRPDDVELILDEPPSRGPLSGLAAALRRMHSHHLVALAVDMPFMTSAHLHSLCLLAQNGCGVLPMIGERAEPLAAIYPREAQPDFCAALLGNDFSMQSLCRYLVCIGKIRIVEVSNAERKFYRSINQPQDLTAEDFA